MDRLGFDLDDDEKFSEEDATKMALKRRRDAFRLLYHSALESLESVFEKRSYFAEYHKHNKAERVAYGQKIHLDLRALDGRESLNRLVNVYIADRAIRSHELALFLDKILRRINEILKHEAPSVVSSVVEAFCANMREKHGRRRR